MYMEAKGRPLFIVDEIRTRESAEVAGNEVHRMNQDLREAYREAS
jgi:hypothetical protein